jgi:hypothetical protein
MVSVRVKLEPVTEMVDVLFVDVMAVLLGVTTSEIAVLLPDPLQANVKVTLAGTLLNVKRICVEFSTATPLAED